MGSGSGHELKRGRMMDVVVEVLRAALMMGFIVAIILALAGLFMVVFGIATGIDRRIQE